MSCPLSRYIHPLTPTPFRDSCNHEVPGDGRDLGVGDLGDGGGAVRELRLEPVQI